ncbi:YqgU-like beta propeller domain-containing protein [Peribacillus huizhouensis]|uniref:YqgU-like 6-bladed beta-propeller domain-containing protein n=1 Tax=Peribacillus huizhouensis TaxID=1501239 RepID=A0ABR6CL37_9BACI|nr:hypothetical protein [Peribacillus huizhouensis]MBA9025416.1 hypothetical protein [Peribacillus huizhouensis]
MEVEKFFRPVAYQLLQPRFVANRLNIRLILCIISTFLLLSACEATNNEETLKPEKDLENPIAVKDNDEIPEFLIDSHEQIEKVYGWLDSSTILYASKLDESDSLQLMSWNFKTQEKLVFYLPTDDIVDVSISPDHSYVLVRLAPLANKAIIEVLNHDGTKAFSASVPSIELAYEWNIHDPGVLFLSSFFEDWSFRTYIVNTKEQKIEAIEFPQPFVKWGSKEELLYLDWNEDEPNLKAPLMKKNLYTKQWESIMLDVIYFSRTAHTLMTIQDQSENYDKATYSFFNDENKLISSFSAPHLKNYSNWLIPYFDMREESSQFISFIPEKAANVGQYAGGFSLQVFNWKTEKEEVILTKTKNEPISCSPNGNWCLYGNQFEKIINLNNKTVKHLFRINGQ